MVKYQNNKKIAYFNGERFCRDDKTGYYLSSKSYAGKRTRLHIAVWAFYHGDVPQSMQVHHKDFDKSNNDIKNLELKTRFSHLSLHAKMHTYEHMKNFHDAGIVAAKKWHASKEGKLWHKKHYQIFKGNLYKKEKFVCLVCGKEYLGVKGEENKFCSNNCKSAYRRKLGVDNEKRTCVVCGKEYTVNKYSKTKCCSRECGRISRIQTMQNKKH